MLSLGLLMGVALAAQGNDLKSIDMVMGNGLVAAKGDVVTVLYRGNLLDGKVFDETAKKPPFAFVLGEGNVIKGWDDGVQGMKVGGRRILSVPPKLGYGDRAIGDLLPANSTLVFDITLLRVDKKGATPKVDIEELGAGTGAKAEDGKTVSVHYKGTFLNGEPFDDSYSRKAPISFKLGSGQVVKGFEDGVRGMLVGGKRKVTMPYMLAYGPNGRAPVIPPYATLVFELELVEVK